MQESFVLGVFLATAYSYSQGNDHIGSPWLYEYVVKHENSAIRVRLERIEKDLNGSSSVQEPRYYYAAEGCYLLFSEI